MSAKAVAQIMSMFGTVVRAQLDVDSNNYPIGALIDIDGHVNTLPQSLRNTATKLRFTHTLSTIISRAITQYTRYLPYM